MGGEPVRWTRVAIIAAAALGALAIAMNWENSLLYFPARELASSPEAHGLRADELVLPTDDGERLWGWWIHGEGKRAVLFFHGNAGNAADRLERARLLNARFGLDVFLVDYRGYGRSTGSPAEEGLYRDARAIYRAARERGFAPEQIVLFGESLGSAVAVALAGEVPVGAVVLETPFLSVPEMAREHYPWVPAFLIRSRFDSAARVASITAPKLFLVAERDEIAPPEQGRRLYALARAPKNLYVIPGAHHNDTYAAGGEAYWRALGEFLAALPEAGVSGR
jgi:fermentation-respiration switch protein FrsA (DUF1100 family)